MNARTPEVVEYWRAFAGASGIAHDDYDVISFGDGAGMADRLAELVLNGTKRATAGLLRDFTAGGEAMPRKGEHVVLIDGSGRPRCVWRTTEVSIKPFLEVDLRFALDERAEIVLERFAVVWPPDAAD